MKLCGYFTLASCLLPVMFSIVVSLVKRLSSLCILLFPFEYCICVRLITLSLRLTGRLLLLTVSPLLFYVYVTRHKQKIGNFYPGHQDFPSIFSM